MKTTLPVRVAAAALFAAMISVALALPAAATHDNGLGKSQDGQGSDSTILTLDATASSIPATPEPSSMAVFLGLAAGAGLFSRRRQRP